MRISESIPDSICIYQQLIPAAIPCDHQYLSLQIAGWGNYKIGSGQLICMAVKARIVRRQFAKATPQLSLKTRYA
jgi:hypothetical protein